MRYKYSLLLIMAIVLAVKACQDESPVLDTDPIDVNHTIETAAQSAKTCVDNDINYSSIPMEKGALVGQNTNRFFFENPHANIPAQCYIETSNGTQNACLFCHTNAPTRAFLGNQNAQAGLNRITGNLQTSYAFVPARPGFFPNPSVNSWENTLFPQKLQDALAQCGMDTQEWNTTAYIREDNWAQTYAHRPGSPKEWNSGYKHPLRLFPGLNPAHLPADNDGYVRSSDANDTFFHDGTGYITGWRALNFMPYGIFTPHTGSVSGIYIRLPEKFMQHSSGEHSLAVYSQNLDLLERAIQDRLLESDPAFFYGQASTIQVERGLYPIGTEFAHPLHYVDAMADGTNQTVSPFGGTRSRRVKEIRYMYKYKMFHPGTVAEKEENAPIYLNGREGWVDNSAGWILAAFIEAGNGTLRPQNDEELLQCVGCHSDLHGMEPATFVSGTGNTIDSTWAMPRKFAHEAGWKEMDYLGYRYDTNASQIAPAGHANMGDPINAKHGKGELRFFLEHVVGASLYGVMPDEMETFMQDTVSIDHGYSANWPNLDTTTAQSLIEAQRLRLALMRELTAKKAYLNSNGTIKGAFLYPSLKNALQGATQYRKIVTTQRYTKGKDAFSQTPFTFKYYRLPEHGYTHIDDKTPYQMGEVITDRPINHDKISIEWDVGTVDTLIDTKKSFEEGGTFYGEFMPLLQYPNSFEEK